MANRAIASSSSGLCTAFTGRHSWFRDLGGRALGLRPVSDELCVFWNGRIFVVFYVDDILWISRPEHAEECHAIGREMEKAFEMRHMGDAHWFLGIRIVRDRKARKLWLCQDSYIDKLATRFHLGGGGAQPPSIPVTEIPPASAQQSTPTQIKEFQEELSSLLTSHVFLHGIDGV